MVDLTHGADVNDTFQPGDWGVVLKAWQTARDSQDWQKPYNSRRIFHGRGRCYSGLEGVCLDLFDGLLLLTLFSKPDTDVFADFLLKLQAALPTESSLLLLIQHRYLPGAPIESSSAIQEGFARRGNLRFKLSFEQQNVGFFLDMEPGREWLAERCKGKRVLNLFSYTCAFSVVACAAQAASVYNVDMSKRALQIGRENHRINQLATGKVGFHSLDILKSWGRLRRAGPFDIIIIDPPSAQAGSFVAEKDYQKVIKHLPELAAPGADILACLNAPYLPAAFLENVFAEQIRDATLIQRLASSQDFPDESERARLKLLHFTINT